MKIEILFSEMGIYYGDYGNIVYLTKCLPQAEFIYTNNLDKPRFLSEKIDLVYMGSLSENNEAIAISRLMPYKDEIKEKIEEGVFFLFTGNAIEVLGSYIETEGEGKIEALNIFDFSSKRNFKRRLNYLVMGEDDDIIILGNKSQYSEIYGLMERPFMEIIKGLGNNVDDKNEGIHYHNLYATYLLGPLLVLNPLFTKKLLKEIGYEGKLAYEEDIMAAYDKRLDEMNNPKLRYKLSEH